MATPLTKPSLVWSDKIVAPFRASPAKASTITGLFVILVIMWVRFFIGGHIPAVAQGSIASAAPSPAVAVAPAGAHPAAGESLSLEAWARLPVQPLSRNPFAIPLDYYPRDGAKASDDVPAGTGYWDLLRKSLSSQADQQEQRQILVDNVRIAAGALKLQSTIMSAQPGAIINGQTVQEGSTIDGFRILKIEARQVIVERQGIKLAVLMD